MKNIVFVTHRESKGLSQVELAAELGICKDYVNMIENNRRMQALHLLKELLICSELQWTTYFFTLIKNKICNKHTIMFGRRLKVWF